MPTATKPESEDATFYDEPSPGEHAQDKTAYYNPHNSDHDLPIQGSSIGSLGPVGEPGLPPSRPVSVTTGGSSRAPLRPSETSRAGMHSPPPMFRGGSLANDGQRPDTSTNRTHVPNITASNFFRPMSSKQQREQHARPMSPVLQQPILSRASEDTVRSKKRGHRPRRSDASIITVDHNQRPYVDTDAPPIPTSQDGTHFTSSPTEDQMRALRDQNSKAPLRPKQVNNLGPPPQSSARSDRSKGPFRQSFGWQRKQGPSKEPKDLGHRRLESNPSSPDLGLEKHMPSTHQGRNYEYYNGNAFFLLNGRLMNARQRPINAITGFLMALPAALFFAFSASYLSHSVSVAIPICFAILFYICISSYLHASFSDPGILPRNLHPHPPTDADKDPLAIGPSTSDWVMVRSWEKTAPGAPITAMEVPVKYCQSCKIWRPPRAHHCRICDACIETQDHHCVWLNNCVGRRNYRQFFTFVSSGALLAIFLLGASIGHVVLFMSRNSLSFGGAIKSSWQTQGAFAMFIYAIFILTYPLSLWGYHVFLIVRGESTREYLNSHKFLKKDRHRPFDQRSLWRNLVSVLFRPSPPTYMQFKAPHVEGDTRLGDTRKRDVKAGQSKEKEEVEMKHINGNGAAPGFKGPEGRGPLNSTPRGKKAEA